MDLLAPADLAELSFARETVIDAQFQFWLTITFAVLVASFVAGRRLGAPARAAIAVLYACAVIVLTSRAYYVAAEANAMRQQLQGLGMPLITPWITLLARITLVALGTTATLVFLLTNWMGSRAAASTNKGEVQVVKTPE